MTVPFGLADDLDRHRVRVVDERARDVLDQFLGRHVDSSYLLAGRMPCSRNRRATVSDGWAPLASQAFALSASITTSTGSVRGL